MPGKVSEGARLRKRLMELEKHLENQIAEERYEAAAAVRDQIKKIEVKLQIDGSEGEQE
jgi:protein-arginine kinase activator protein McsA